MYWKIAFFTFLLSIYYYRLIWNFLPLSCRNYLKERFRNSWKKQRSNSIYFLLNYLVSSPSLANFDLMNRKVAQIMYERLGQHHSIYVPYSIRKVARLSGHRAFLLKGDKEMEITQQAGLPYLITATDLEGSAIKIIHAGKTTLFEGTEKVDLDRCVGDLD